MINASEAREDDESFKNPVDIMFDELEVRDPDHFAVKQYRKYKLAAGKTAKSILISCGARLAPFDIAELPYFHRSVPLPSLPLRQRMEMLLWKHKPPPHG